jgi:hypothetical protein
MCSLNNGLVSKCLIKLIFTNLELLEGKYANYFKVGYNAFEFVIDFGQCYSDDEEAQLHTRIITSSSSRWK